MNIIKETMRWICVLPAWLLGYALGHISFAIGTGFYNAEVARALAQDLNGFGGHYILGPLLVLTKSVACGVFSFVGVALVAPRAKREASLVVASVLATLTALSTIIVVIRWDSGTLGGETLLRFLLEAIPVVVAGFGISFQIPHGATDHDLRGSSFHFA